MDAALPQAERLYDEPRDASPVGPDRSLIALLNAIAGAQPAFSPAQVVALYLDWPASGGRYQPEAFAAWFNIGATYVSVGGHASAVLAFEQALKLKPDLHAARLNLGIAQEGAGEPQRAIATWAAGVQPDKERTALLNQQGRLLETNGQLDEAEATLRRSLGTERLQPDVIQHWVHLRQKMCRWPILDPRMGLSEAEVMEYCGPLAMLALTDDVDQQRRTAASWIARKTAPTGVSLAPAEGYGHERLRIGYLSSDFCSHAMSYLVAELFERHDRTRFELFAYCASPDDGTAIRQRVLSAFDHLRLIGALSDEQAARLIREDEIDILIDLNGLTAGSRTAILRWRPAPKQATYLAFVGPVPLPELDALICDAFVVPWNEAASYGVPPLYVDGLFQANESRRDIASGVTRAAAGLPDGRFVFACFSRHYKITPTMFAAWMSILQQAPDSVLWLTHDNPWSTQALREAAQAAGVDADRLIFAPRCAPDLYMARLGLADLFLDTFPYNAGTVASDAVRMRLPIVTLPGRSFASRMAARVLDAYGVRGGIAKSLDDYVAKAVRFATDPAAFKKHRASFTDKRWAGTIGDAERFTRRFEDALLRLNGVSPA